MTPSKLAFLRSFLPGSGPFPAVNRDWSSYWANVVLPWGGLSAKVAASNYSNAHMCPLPTKRWNLLPLLLNLGLATFTNRMCSVVEVILGFLSPGGRARLVFLPLESAAWTEVRARLPDDKRPHGEAEDQLAPTCCGTRYVPEVM